jgi:hypothetical protein
MKVAAAYCPPAYKIEKKQFTKVFAKLGPRFIIGGDFNVKHTAWGSRIITPKKGHEMLRAINEASCEYHSSRKPTYWPTDPMKIPDLLDFFVTKGVSNGYLEVEDIDDLTSDHSPVIMTLSTEIIKKKQKPTLVSKSTDWKLFRERIDDLVKLKVRLKTTQDIDEQAERFVEIIKEAAKQATPITSEKPIHSVSYPLEVRQLVRERRKLRRKWHQTRLPEDKTLFNRTSNRLNRLIKKIKQESFNSHLLNLSPQPDQDYSLWKATKRFKRPVIHVPPLKNAQGGWARRDEEKAELFAQHLATVFQPNEVQIDDVNTLRDKLPEEKIKLVTPAEVKREITNMKVKKAPGINKITSNILKQLPRKGIVMLTYLINACFRLKYVPLCFKTAEIIMIKKPDKPANEVTSYRPISLLPVVSKLFEKLFSKRLKPLINLPDFQFGF